MPIVTVEDLIAKLQAYPAKMPVCVQGYEGGYVDAEHLEIKNLARDTNDWDASLWGQHSEKTELAVQNQEKEFIPHLVILRWSE